MNVLVVGSGGREHAIIKKLKESKRNLKIYAAPGNGGISMDAECVDISVMDFNAISEFATTHSIDFAVVAPDDPLAGGLVDILEAKGIKCFGPSKMAAEIEASKVFSKNLMKKYNIPTAKYETFNNPKDAVNYIESQNSFPIVVKADGLALGKGVIIAEDLKMAEDAVHSIMEDKIFGASGNSILIEEFLTGPEVSVLAFTDGKTVVPMVSSMDHKRALDGNKGLNTGGMGTIAPNPYYTEDIAKVCMDEIFLPTIDAMNKEGRKFKGCLYFGLMLTKNGPKVIEYNCRFGDPETQVVLPLLESDIMDIFEAVADEKLDSVDVKWSNKCAACVMIASGGYPVKYEKGFTITGLNKNGGVESDSIVYHSGTKFEDGVFKNNGGRVLGIASVGKTLDEALDKSYKSVKMISFKDMHYRTDIGRAYKPDQK